MASYLEKNLTVINANDERRIYEWQQSIRENFDFGFRNFEKIKDYEIFDISGRKIKKFERGIYFIKLKNDKKCFKIIIKK